MTNPSTDHSDFPLRHRSVSAARLTLLGLLALIAAGSVVNHSMAAFSLNWQRDYNAEGASFSSNDAYVACNMSYISDANCGSGGFGGDFNLNGSHDDGTAFLQEQLTLGGQLYFHVIVGDYTKDKMAQEVFIKASSGNQSFSGIRVSDGVVNGSDISMEFLKDSFSQKPLITQTISNAEMVSTMTMDMRGKNYSQLTPIDHTAVTNTLELLGATRQGTQGNYDLQEQAQTSHFSAGGFSYTSCSVNGGSGGVYTWSDPIDNFQPMNRNYQGYCNASQNTNWSGNGACTNDSGGGGGGGWGW